MRKCCSSRVSKSSACRLSIPSALKKSPSGASFSRGTLKCAAAKFNISSSVWSLVGITLIHPSATLPCHKSLLTDSRQVRLHGFILYKLSQPLFDGWLRIQVAKNVDLLLQFFVWNRLHKSLGRRRSCSIKLPHL